MKNQGSYFRHGSSLALYKKIGNHENYWDDLWQSTSIQDIYKRAKTGGLGEFEKPFMKYLPENGKILEAGCGTGKYVWALQARGFQIEGIDYAEETIRRIKEVDPELKVRVGDIYAIDCPDDYYFAYISIGVLEHNYDGQMAGLREAYRVLLKGGIALISVPYINWRRRKLWENSPEANDSEQSSGFRFYQDHLDVSVFSSELLNAGFQILELYPYGFIGGLERDWKLWRWLAQHNYLHWRIARLIRRFSQKAPRWIKYDLSHMMMWVCRKP